MITGVLSVYSLSKVLYDLVMKPLAEPFENMPGYGNTRSGHGRTKLFLTYMIMDMLLVIADMVVVSYVRGTNVIQPADVILFYILGGALLVAARLRSEEERRTALGIVSVYCAAFIITLLARSVVALQGNESLPFVLGQYGVVDIALTVGCFVAVPSFLVLLLEPAARRRFRPTVNALQSR
jgi:hypothetical protein